MYIEKKFHSVLACFFLISNPSSISYSYLQTAFLGKKKTIPKDIFLILQLIQAVFQELMPKLNFQGVFQGLEDIVKNPGVVPALICADWVKLYIETCCQFGY